MNSQPTNLHVYDDLNHLFLTALYLPAKTAFFAAVKDIAPGSLRSDWKRLPVEEGLCRALRALAAAEAEAHLAPGAGNFDTASLETYLFLPSGDAQARLQSWFVDEPATTYRVLLHHTPVVHTGRPLPVLWDAAYEQLRGGKTPGLRYRNVSMDALRQGAVVLEEGLQAYRSGPDSVRTFIDGLGHPYRHVV